MIPVVHFEVPFNDEKRAKDFYKGVFGWDIQDWPLEDGTTYIGVNTSELGEDRMPLKKGVIGGGMVPKSVVKNPVLVLDTQDAEALATKAVAAGAKRISDHAYLGVGKMIYIEDTEENVVGIWEETKKPESEN